MRIIGATEVAEALEDRLLIERLRQMFRTGCATPMRHHHAVPVPGGADATLVLMPAWQAGRHIGVKIVTAFPDNGTRGLPTVTGSYLLLDGTTGAPLALLDGQALTLHRTAAASALAAHYLAREDAHRLVMVGTGALAPHLVAAHATVRPIGEVLIWGRDPEKARRLAARLDLAGRRIAAVTDLAAAVREADIVSCATLATAPLLQGAWLRPGAHLDLVGGFRPDMREADDEAVRRARVFVDTRAGALKEAGDIVQPLAAGVLHEHDIAADLFELTRGERAGRQSYTEITLFKSVGTALEDLAAAQLVLDRV